MKIRTRFAPSPTGSLHIGGLRTAIYAYALAKHSDGDFILRIEDTDKKREVKGSKKEIENILEDFDLLWDEKYIQSERVKTGIYERYAKKLVDEGHAYYCDCEARNAKEEGYSKILRDPCRDKGKTKGAIKLKVPEEREVSFVDFVIGKEIKWNTSDIADTVLLKSDGFPTYHLAVVVDDVDMKITHVLRGYDWMPSTPIHLLVYEYLGFKRPEIGHLTDILDPEGGKLSKRKGSVSVNGLLKEGYLKEALFNFVILLGWAPKDNEEFFDLKSFVKEFSEKGFQKSNPIFNKKKLIWMNGEYIRKLPVEKLDERLLTRKSLYSEQEKKVRLEVLELVKTRANTLVEIEDITKFFFKKPKVNISYFEKDYKKHLRSALEVFENLKSWDLDSINKGLMNKINKEKYKVGDFFMTLRIAISGSRFTPPINESIEIIGKKECISRIESVLSLKK